MLQLGPVLHFGAVTLPLQLDATMALSCKLSDQPHVILVILKLRLGGLVKVDANLLSWAIMT
jgi:hypothetical protein